MAYTTTHGALHPDVVPHLDEEFTTFYNEALLGTPALDYNAPFDPTIRDVYLAGAPGAPEGVEVKDIKLKDYSVRVFTPPGEKPINGWPVLIFYHGGGWVLGSPESAMGATSYFCIHCSCVVVSVDYRLAPEHPYPAGVEDAWDVVEWVHGKGPSLLGINPNRIAVGGGSAGGHLSAVVSHMAVLAEPPIPICFQLLIVPCTDLDPGASSYPSRTLYAFAPSLPAARMQWFYKLFAAPPEEWKASPIKAPPEHWHKLPPALVAVAGLDFLRDEGIAYANLLKERGVPTELKVYKGVPHNFSSLAPVLTRGREFLKDAVERLTKAFATV